MVWSLYTHGIMRWIPRDEAGEMYCSVHNVDCESNSRMVLEPHPHLIPSSWMCPEAVEEIARFETEAEEFILDENETCDECGHGEPVEELTNGFEVCVNCFAHAPDYLKP